MIKISSEWHEEPKVGRIEIPDMNYVAHFQNKVMFDVVVHLLRSVRKLSIEDERANIQKYLNEYVISTEPTGEVELDDISPG